MVYDLVHQGYNVEMLSFNYGQRHSKELRFASVCARRLGLRHDVVDISALANLLAVGKSSLVSNVPVPEGHYEAENMAATVVPNRNMVMLSIACSVAVARKANTVATAVHSGDHFIYPDCRPQFIYSVGQAMLDGNAGFHNFSTPLTEEQKAAYAAQGIEAEYSAQPITTPYLYSTKADIAYRALQLGVSLHMTWSCYQGLESHCGKCGTCVERLEAIDEARKRMAAEVDVVPPDNTQYKDTEYWKVVVATRAREQAQAELEASRQAVQERIDDTYKPVELPFDDHSEVY